MLYLFGAKIRLFLVTSKVFEEMLWVSAKRKYAALGRSLIEAPSPGHRPGLLRAETCRPVRAKALKL